MGSEKFDLDTLIIGAGPAGLATLLRWASSDDQDDTVPDHLAQGAVGRGSILAKMNGRTEPRLSKAHVEEPQGSNDPASRAENGQWPSISALNGQKVAVMDPSGEWLHRWRSSFAALRIDRLRSPAFHHLDPTSINSLLSWAETQGRANELSPLPEGVFNQYSAGANSIDAILDESSDEGEVEENGGKDEGEDEGEVGDKDEVVDLADAVAALKAERSQRSQRDARRRTMKRSKPTQHRPGKFATALGAERHHSFVLPSSSVFEDFIADLVSHTDVTRQVPVVAASVQELHPLMSGEKVIGWTVKTSDQGLGVIRVRRVVVSVGTTNLPRIPPAAVPWLSCKPDSESWREEMSAAFMEKPHELFKVPFYRLLHTAQTFIMPFSPKHKDRSILEEAGLEIGEDHSSIAVIGGGTTAAHIVALALRLRSVRYVHWVIPNSAVVRPFDVDVSWLAQWNGAGLARYYAASPEKRAKVMNVSRRAGTMAPAIAHSILEWNEVTGGWAARDDRVKLHLQTRLAGMEWAGSEDWSSGSWKLDLENSETGKVEEDHPEVHAVWLATGTEARAQSDPVFAGVQAAGIEPEGGWVDGLPVVDADLSWGSGVPLWVNGGYAALAVGPTAGNLAGAMAGARRLSDALSEPVEEAQEVEVSKKNKGKKGKKGKKGGRGGNMFELLSDDDDDDAEAEE